MSSPLDSWLRRSHRPESATGCKPHAALRLIRDQLIDIAFFLQLIPTFLRVAPMLDNELQRLLVRPSRSVQNASTSEKGTPSESGAARTLAEAALHISPLLRDRLCCTDARAVISVPPRENWYCISRPKSACERIENLVHVRDRITLELLCHQVLDLRFSKFAALILTCAGGFNDLTRTPKGECTRSFIAFL